MDAGSSKRTVKIPEGELVGHCENCGLVREDDLEMDFPHGSTCQECGEEVEKTKALTEPKEVAVDAVY